MKAHLLLKYIQGNATAEEKEEFMRWVNGSEEHMKEYLALRKIYTLSLWHIPEKVQPVSSKQTTLKRFLFPFLKIASVVALCFLFQYIYFTGSSPEESLTFQTIRVPAGQRVELELADGTNVWLNSGSTFYFPGEFKGAERRVRLDGEGYFLVTHDEELPFIVQTSGYDVTVLGTEFNVIAYDRNDLFEASLLKGSIEISSQASGEKLLLYPQQKVITENGRLHRTLIENHDYFLWKEGILVFDDAPVEEIFRKMEACFQLKIEVQNKQLLQQKFTAKFRTVNGPEHFLRVLQLKTDFRYEIDTEKNTIVIR